jgi:hypothetical protein
MNQGKNSQNRKNNNQSHELLMLNKPNESLIGN